MELNRSEINRALAKAIAYKQCGAHQKSAQWAIRLVNLLDATGILDRDMRFAMTDELEKA